MQIAYFMIGSWRAFRQRLGLPIDPDRPHPHGPRARDVDVRPVAHEHRLGRGQPQAVQRFPEYTRSGLAPPDCVGDQTKAKAKALKAGDCMLLENLRFHKEETIKDKAAKEDAQLREAKDNFAKQLADLADIYVDDAFGTAHRDNASMYTVPMMMEGKPRVIGFLIEKELRFL